jgi:hypothetical protein
MNCLSVYWIHEGMPYVDESKLPKCGCGGNPQVYFVFDYENEKFTDVSVLCKECNIQTPIVDNIDTAIKTWQNAFSKDDSEYYDVCTGCSGNFGKEEYY